MANSVIVTIPNPCHEKWSEMTPADRGRFCAACQKTVRDFTFVTDSEIVNAVNSEANLCGRFTPSQLDRKLYLKRPARKPYAIAAGIAALLGFGGYEANAQEPVKKEIVQNPKQNKNVSEDSLAVSGVVTDPANFPVPGVEVVNRTTQDTVTTDFDGKYSIAAKVEDEIQFTYPGMVSQNIIVGSERNVDISLADDIIVGDSVVLVGGIALRRTFFGRIFHRIGNWFR